MIKEIVTWVVMNITVVSTIAFAILGYKTVVSGKIQKMILTIMMLILIVLASIANFAFISEFLGK